MELACLFILSNDIGILSAEKKMLCDNRSKVYPPN
jgi:hypothetical protein